MGTEGVPVSLCQFHADGEASRSRNISSSYFALQVFQRPPSVKMSGFVVVTASRWYLLQ